MKHSRSFPSLLLALLSIPAMAADKIRVVNEGGIRDEWTLAPGTKLATPGYPKVYEDNPAETCVAIAYLINPDGSTSDFAMVKAWSANEPTREKEAYWAAFAQEAASALSQWKFQPKAGVLAPRPVYTVGTFLFASAQGQETRKRCAIPNLAHRLIELREGDNYRRRMSGGLFDQLQLDPFLEDRYRQQQLRNGGMRNFERSEPPPPPPPPPAPSSP